MVGSANSTSPSLIRTTGDRFESVIVSSPSRRKPASWLQQCRQAPAEESGPDEQHDRQRQLRDDEGVAKSPYGGAPRVTPFGILEGFARFEAAPLPSRPARRTGSP